MTRLAFTWDDGAAENAMIGAFRASPDFRADWFVVAEVGGQVAGHVMVAPVQLQGDQDSATRARRVRMLGPVSVAPERQRQGIGSALVRAILSGLRGAPEPMVVLWGHRAFYPRFGLRPAAAFGLLPDVCDAMVYPLQPDLSAYAGLSVPK